MYLEYFLKAREYLRGHGLQAEVKMGSPVTQGDLNALDLETDLPMPAELRRFYLELGDGFHFEPDENDQLVTDFDLVGWEHMRLSEHRICNIGFAGAVEEEALYEINCARPRVDVDLLKVELERRKQWMPFYGFVGGGDYLCLDLSMTPPAVRFYASLTWRACPQDWSFILASSLTEFVEQWSRYHFLSPSGAWTSFCHERRGRFGWEPEHFPQINPLAR